MARKTLFRLLPPLAGFALFCSGGCGDGTEGRDVAPGVTRVVTTGPAGTGAIRGTVKFSGTAPEPERVEGSRCHSGAREIEVAPIVVGDGGALRDVMVYVKDPSAVPSDKPVGPVVLDQVNCRYVPHVLGVQVGQVLRVTTSDPTMHNVHTLPENNPSANFGMTKPGQSRDLTFQSPDRFPVKCDVHPWMTAHVYVFDHPFFAVTGGNGTFEITGLPPGEHRVVFSHAFLGERERVVKVDAGAATADVTFERGKY
jgi:plastocyanin